MVRRETLDDGVDADEATEPHGDDDLDLIGQCATSFKYFSGLATIANVWKSTGIPDKLKTFLDSLPDAGSEVSLWVCARLPGRVLRGRWGSIDEVEELICPRLAWLKLAFVAIFVFSSSKKKRTKRRKKQTPGQEEAQQFNDEQNKYRLNATRLLQNHWFSLSLHISRIVKSPLTHFYRWATKRIQEVNIATKAAVDAGNLYLGPTMFSDLVDHRCAAVLHEIDQLLGEGRHKQHGSQ